MKSMKKVFAITAIGALSLGALAGCTTTYNQDEVNQMIEDAKLAANKAGFEDGKEVGVQSVDVDAAVAQALEEYKNSEEITSTNTELEETQSELQESQEEIDRLKAVLEDYEEAEQKVEQEMQFLAGSEEIKLNLGDSFGDTIYYDGDVEKLLDTDIEFNDESYDVHEEIETTNDLKVAFSLMFEEDFADVPYIITEDEGALRYNFVFDEPINISEIDRDETLEISFLGKDMTITDVKSNEFEIKVGNSNWLDVGNELVIDNTKVVVHAVTEDGKSAGLLINDELHWVDLGEDVEASGITVAVEDIKVIHSEGSDASVKLTAAGVEDVYRTFEIGDSVIYDEDEDDAEFVYDLDVSVTDELNSISVVHNQKIDELDDDFSPIAEGNSIVFPNEYVSLMFDSTNVENYNKISMEFDDFETDEGTPHFDGDGIVFSGNDDESFEISGKKTTQIFAWYDAGMWSLAYMNDDNDIESVADISFDIVFEDTTYKITYDGNFVSVTNNDSDVLGIDVNDNGTHFTHLGNTAEDAESAELVLTDNANAINIGVRDDNVLGADGIIVLEPEDNGDNDVVEFLVPEDKLELKTYLG